MLSRAMGTGRREMADRALTIAAIGILALLLVTAGCVSPTPATAVPAVSALTQAEEAIHGGEGVGSESSIPPTLGALQFEML
jgi:hypothetical protein